VRSGVGLQNCTPDSFAAEYQKTMKPLQQRCKPTDTGTAAKLGGSTMQSLKPGKYINKSSGNVLESCSQFPLLYGVPAALIKQN
jgi:hypothetical protein